MIEWEEIKNYWRNEFKQTEIYRDENEHIIVFKKDDEFILLGYLHYNSVKSFMSGKDFIDFIDFIKKLGNENYVPFKIYLLCNNYLSNISNPNQISSLPNDVNYYHVNYNKFYKTIEFKLEDIVKSAENSRTWEYANKPWYHKKHIPVITDSKFENWEEWSRRGYKREWYEITEYDKFDSNWDIGSIISASSVYIDDRFIWGFYVVWKYESYDE